MDFSTLLSSSARLSEFSGIVSISLWVMVYQPQVSFDQLWLTYKQQSGDGLSVLFLLLWLAGDVTNLLGAYWGQLAGTMIVLACYYAACDIILIGQVYYYRRKRQLYPELYEPIISPSDHHLPSLPSESDPLLSAFSATDPAHPISAQVKRHRDLLGFIGIGIGFILVTTAAWIFSGRTEDGGQSSEVWDFSAQVVGWISAFLYLGSRIPQIIKNSESRCVGLSMTMFGIAVLGNITYVASILLKEGDNQNHNWYFQHLLINASWLVGSGGTIFLDFIVLGQFYYYSNLSKSDEKLLLDEEIGVE